MEVALVASLAAQLHTQGERAVATAEEYEAALIKAETLGLTKLKKPELELLKKLTKEAGSRGNRARKAIEK